MEATEERLRETLFGAEPAASCVLAYQGERPVAFALFYFTYSTFAGLPGLYLEDLFVKPEIRGQGLAEPYCGIWQIWRRRKAVGGSSGPCCTGTSRRLVFMKVLAQCRWMSGRSTDYLEKLSQGWLRKVDPNSCVGIPDDLLLSVFIKPIWTMTTAAFATVASSL